MEAGGGGACPHPTRPIEKIPESVIDRIPRHLHFPQTMSLAFRLRSPLRVPQGRDSGVVELETHPVGERPFLGGGSTLPKLKLLLIIAGQIDAGAGHAREYVHHLKHHQTGLTRCVTSRTVAARGRTPCWGMESSSVLSSVLWSMRAGGSSVSGNTDVCSSRSSGMTQVQAGTPQRPAWTYFFDLGEMRFLTLRCVTRIQPREKRKPRKWWNTSEAGCGAPNC